MSKTKYHAPTRSSRRNKTEKSKSSRAQAPICITPEVEERKEETRQWLQDNETPKLIGRFNAFEETLAKFAAKFAPNGPEYQRRQLTAYQVDQHCKWVRNFKGVMVKRQFLDVGHKKGKAWADQHRAQYLGEAFFVDLLCHLEEFIRTYRGDIIPDLTVKQFRCECIVGVLKRTFSPEHNQAGDTLLICDQAVKSGPTRDQLGRLVDGLISIRGVKKGRDVVAKLEDILYAEDGALDVKDDGDADVDVDVVDTSSNGSADESRMMSLADEAMSVAGASVGSDEVVAMRPPDWSTFPISGQPRYDSGPAVGPAQFGMQFLVVENRRLKDEVDTLRRQLVAYEAMYQQPPPRVDYPAFGGYDNGDYEMDYGREYGDYTDHMRFSLNPQPVIASRPQY